MTDARMVAPLPHNTIVKDGGLIRQISSNAKPTFYPCTVIRQPLPLPEGALNYRWSAADCIVLMGGVTKGNSIVYDFVVSIR